MNVFEGQDFNLDEIRDMIIGYGIDPQEAKNLIMATLKENYGEDSNRVELCNNQNPPISKKMNYFIHGDVWLIKVRKEKSGAFLHGDFVTLNIDFKGQNANKLVFAIETLSNKMAPIGVCPMHENRLQTKVSTIIATVNKILNAFFST